MAKFLLRVFPGMINEVDIDHHTAMDYAVEKKHVRASTSSCAQFYQNCTARYSTAWNEEFQGLSRTFCTCDTREMSELITWYSLAGRYCRAPLQ